MGRTSVNRLCAALALLLLLLSVGSAAAQTQLESYIYNQNGATSISGQRIPTAPSATQNSLQYFGLSSLFGFSSNNLVIELPAGDLLVGNGSGIAAPVALPASGDLIVSGGSSAPTGLAPTNGDCAVGSGGAWAVGACISHLTSSDSSITITDPTGPTTNIDLSAIGNNTVLGNISGSSAIPSALSKANLTTLCNTFTTSLSGCVPSSPGGTTEFMRADGSWAAPSGSFGVETPTFSGGAYTLGSGDANYRILVGGQASVVASNVYVYLPTNSGGSPFPSSTAFEIVNQSNATAVPIAYVGTPGTNGTCANPCTSSFTSTWTIGATGDTVIARTQLCGPGPCTSTPPSITSVSDSKSGTWTQLAAQSDSITTNRTETWMGTGFGSTGADTITFNYTGSAYYAVSTNEELSGLASSPAEQENSGTGTGTSFSLALAGALSRRGDLIIAGNNLGNVPTGFAPFAEVGSLADLDYAASGAPALGYATWSYASSSYWAGTVLGLMPAKPYVHVWVCQAGSTSTIYGTPTDTSHCTYPGFPLMPGMWARIIVDSSYNYHVVLSSVFKDADEVTASTHTFDLEDCEKKNLLWSSSTQTMTASPGVLPQGCSLEMVQWGTGYPQISGATGFNLQPANGYYLNGQDAAATLGVLGAGNTGVLFGNISASLP